MATQMRPLQPDNGADLRNVQIPTTMEGPPSVFERRTKSGRVLRYQLTILQQPERARACGSGSKSAADRRPVDPPPVVELLIFDITNGQEKDITFSYNVNFFLFATLEHARPMAHGRVQTPSATSPPVLTGMPVSGMAYLDRPTVAGYFLFPDLSVRHEGRYRLAFNLYEEIKDAGDASIDPIDKISNANPGPSFDWRMEVKSNAFTVYSAKKFPGLTESTLLSRTVADQGCRVRIRRDVHVHLRQLFEHAASISSPIVPYHTFLNLNRAELPWDRLRHVCKYLCCFGTAHDTTQQLCSSERPESRIQHYLL
ncbi:Velvet factor [Ceratocystis platani]|uniref:Velvet factor n=1 Tax=Ceratocystis fimbriata f. sp. platani TaxID=88771 RepID=A0A0F8B6V4_CERFI|nr:Velvet factor [Ceratocystis platani]